MQLKCKCTPPAIGRLRPRWLGIGLFAVWAMLINLSAGAQDLPADTALDAGVPEAPAAPATGENDSDAGTGDKRAVPPANQGTQGPGGLVPPRIISSPPPVFPPAHLGTGEHPTVVLNVTVLADGRIADILIEHSGGADFDKAAIDAVKNWSFEPARRADTQIASRVGVAVHFALPEFGPYNVPAVSRAEEAIAHGHDEHPPASDGTAPRPAFGAKAVTELEQLRPEARGASGYTVKSEVLRAAPRREGADLLSTVPGVYVARSEGEAVAHSINLRGFDAEHGQDVELRVGGIPINLPSHIHGQGYADLGFLIPETVHELRVTEGAYDPRQGDFAVAGSIDFDLAVDQRGVASRSSYGSFNTFRQLALWAPEGESRHTFGAVQHRRSDGFGQNRGSTSTSAILQGRFGTGAWRYRTLGIAYGANASLAGVVRRADINGNRLGFYDSYAFPTAQKQRATSSRVLLSAVAEYRGHTGDSGELGAWLGFDDFRIQQNFTGFTQRSTTLANVAGRGDLIEQLNQTRSLGLWGHYRTKPYQPWQELRGHVELGTSARADQIDQAQNLLDASVRNQTWDRRVDASVRGLDIGVWADLSGQLLERATLRAGVRADALQYVVEDRLGNFAPLSRPQESYIVGFRRTAAGTAWGPRTSLEVSLLRDLQLLAAYGEGYRSPQARTLEDGERAPFTKVRGGDIGLRANMGNLFALGLTGYLTHLSDDVAFAADEGRLERVGATRRLGGTLTWSSNPTPWLISAASVTYVDAQLLEPPPATAKQPQPVFRKGQNLPYVPPVVLRLDLGAHGTLLSDQGPADLTGRAGMGYSYLSRRPLPHGAKAATVSLLDFASELGWGPFTLGMEIFNLLDMRYAATEYNFASNWNPSEPPSRVPARHIAAGAPRTWLFSLGITL